MLRLRVVLVLTRFPPELCLEHGQAMRVGARLVHDRRGVLELLQFGQKIGHVVSG